MGEVLFKRLKRTPKIAGDNAENTPVFSMAFSPDPLNTGAGGIAAFGRSKICFIDDYACN